MSKIIPQPAGDPQLPQKSTETLSAPENQEGNNHQTTQEVQELLFQESKVLNMWFTQSLSKEKGKKRERELNVLSHL